MLNNIAATLGGGVPVSLTDYESIATVTVSSAQSTITFSSIPSTYTHLQIRALYLGSSAEENLRMRFNSDTGSNYARHYVGGNGSATFASGNASESYAMIGLTPNSTQPGVFVADILDYANTNKYKTSRSLYGDDKNGGTGYLMFCSGLWQNTAAVSSIDISSNGSSNFNQYSSFALYGIK